MSKEPVSTIIRSDAPHMVEVKPGSLNASTTKSWVEAGEVKPEDLIDVAEMPQHTTNRQAVHAAGVDPNLQSVATSGMTSNHQALVEPGLAKANHQPVVETDEVKANRQKLSDEAIHDQHVALPPTSNLGTHHEPVPDAGALNDHHEPVDQDHIRDHQEPVPQGQLKDNRQPLDSSATRDHFEPVHASGGLASGPEIPHEPVPARAGAHESLDAEFDAIAPSTDPSAPQGVEAKSVAVRPRSAPPKMDHAKAAVHLTHDPEAFKSRVAAIRESVSHITDHLDHIENKH